jgi:hypothetical protein
MYDVPVRRVTVLTILGKGLDDLSLKHYVWRAALKAQAKGRRRGA